MKDISRVKESGIQLVGIEIFCPWDIFCSEGIETF